MLLTIARSLKLPPSWVYGVATFYHFFSLAPKGEHTCVVCLGTACYVKGAGSVVLAGLEQCFHVKAGQTTPGRQSVAPHRLPLPAGACGLAPAVVFDVSAVAGNLNREGTPLSRVKGWQGRWTSLNCKNWVR